MKNHWELEHLEYLKTGIIKNRIPSKGEDYYYKNYGITFAQYNQRLKKQDYKCKICKTIEDKKRSFAVDHDHVTGKVRGLLCSRCNLMLGIAKDDINILYSGVEYLKNSNKEEIEKINKPKIKSYWELEHQEFKKKDKK